MSLPSTELSAVMSSDPENFLLDYEKPTEAYRYLRARNLCAPLYLYRNLTYMSHRSTRTNKARRYFKVDALLETIENARPVRLGDNITLMYLGYFDKSITDIYFVEVKTFVPKTSLRKCRMRYKQLPPVDQVGISLVPINPDEDTMYPKNIPAVSVPTDKLAGKLVITVQVASNLIAINLLNNDEGPSANSRRTNASMFYEFDLVLFDKQNRCLLFDGEYEILLRNSNAFSAKKKEKRKREENILESREKQKLPVLKFRIAWTNKRYAEFVDWPLYMATKEHQMMQAVQNENNADLVEYDMAIGGGVNYHFFYNNNVGLKTQECKFHACPFCKLNCLFLYSLLKHLKLCHARFSFRYVPSSEPMSKIEVRINQKYDGSYTGSPHDSENTSMSASTIIVCRPHRKKPSLSEFMEVIRDY